VPISDLRNLTVRAVGRLGDKFHSLDRRIDAYRDEPVQDWRAHDLVIRSVDCRAITTSQVPDVVQKWREPSHREFRPRNVWSLSNAIAPDLADLERYAAARFEDSLQLGEHAGHPRRTLGRRESRLSLRHPDSAPFAEHHQQGIAAGGGGQVLD
jgi:hypothetical protein